MVHLPRIKPIASITKAIAPGPTFSRAQSKRLPFFASPLATDRARKNEGIQGPAIWGKQHKHSNSQTSYFEDDYEDEEPDLHGKDSSSQEKHESSTIQLFYDLFFVANLTTFTNVHEINDTASLKSYVGFFAILWFTWFQVALFDIRFSNDSITERIFKAAQFGVMVGFAVVGPSYKIGWEANTPDTAASLAAFKTLTLILMVSRLILACQYAVALVWLRDYRKARYPMLIHICVLFTAAIIFFVLYFAFNQGSGESAVIAWYITIGLEAVGILVVSGRANFLSLSKTSIVERLGLLTLIILGEGIIGLCSAIRTVGSDRLFTSDIIGMIICAVAIIYFLWMIYFDQTETDHMGTIRQQGWAVAHFPFHVAVLLTVEGVAQLSVWRKALDCITPFSDAINPFIVNITNAMPDAATLTALTNVMDSLYAEFNSTTTTVTTFDTSGYYNTLTNATATAADRNNATVELLASGVNYICQNFGITPPEHSASRALDDASFLVGIFSTFDTVFIYFFIAAGLALVLLAMLHLLGKRGLQGPDICGILVRFVIGVGLALLAAMYIPSTGSGDSYLKYSASPWMLPTVALAYGIVIIVDNALAVWAGVAAGKRHETQTIVWPYAYPYPYGQQRV